MLMITKSENETKTIFLSEDSMLRNTKGFTLIELMVVILIIGILAALAIPKFTNASAKAKISEVPTVMGSFENAQLARVAETGATGAVADLVFDAPTGSKWFNYTSPSNGTYQGAATSAIGDFPSGGIINTTVTATGNVTHGTDQQTAVKKLLPNYLP
jgi:prepilin-type N-terminal cleavage/methylation domain-containing protein